MSKADWILGQFFLWMMVVAIVITGTAGIRRSGAMLAAHQAGLVGSRSAYGTSQGLVQAGSDLSAWWGIAPEAVGQAVAVIGGGARRSVTVHVEGRMRTLFGGSADLGAGSFQRIEAFYPGPPDEFE
jgi:hypothetical protein